MKLCFASSSGGHYEQLLMMKPLMKKYNGFIVTEKTGYNASVDVPCVYVKQINRKELLCIPKLLVNTFIAAKVLLKEKPDAIICTGVLAVLPLCILGKLFGKKIIYLESFAKVTSATLSGKLVYKFADRFYVQWEEMLQIYPDAVYKGGIY